MKTKIWMVLAGAILLLLPAHKAMATGACTAARFHDWQDCGCDKKHPGVGGAPTPKNCSDCDHGMPRWWVTEPYISLHISDTPLSYKTSSGKDIGFQLFYRMRCQMPLSDESPITFRSSPYDIYYPFGATVGTNAFWGHNWNMSILIQPSTAGVTPAYSQGYNALVFRPDGGIDNYTNGAGSYTKTLDSQVALQAVSGVGYPLVYETSGGNITNQPTADSNGASWGDPNIGVKLVYPDGSQDVFGLSCYPIFTTGLNFQVSGQPQIRLLLTQRISPQGRITSLGYEFTTFTNWWTDNGSSYGKPQSAGSYRLKYVVDEDGKTNTFVYNNHRPTNSFAVSHACFEDTTNFVASNAPPRNPLQLVEIDDPYGRKAQFGYDLVSGILTNITDAAGLTTHFQYNAQVVTKTDLLPDPLNLCQSGGACPYSITGMGTTGGWITNLITPYGSTGFNFYEVDDSTVTEGVQQRALYVSEPEGAHQLYYYLHKGYSTNGTPLLAQTAQSPTVPGVTDFDDGTGGGTHPTLEYRNSIYWGRRQFAALTAGVQNSLSSNMSNALNALTVNDFRKGRVRNWLWQPDSISISECLSSERDPSPDAQGQIEALRIWYDYPGKVATDTEGTSPQVSCLARLLPDGTSQYTTYHYYPQSPFIAGAGLVSDNETTYTKPDGSIGVLTTSFTYANAVDVSSVSNSVGQYVRYGYNSGHAITSITNALNQVMTFNWDSFANLTGIQFPSGESVTLNRDYYDSGPNSLFPTSIIFSPSGRCLTNSYYAGLPISTTDDRGITVSNTWDGLNRLTSAVYPDGTSVSNVYYRLDLVANKDRLTNWIYYAYDGLQHLITFTNANKAVTMYDWCACGSLNAIFDAQNGLTNPTTLNYDNQRNLTNLVFPDYSTVTCNFDLARRMTNIVDGANRALQISYNVQNLPITITSANGVERQVLYDAVNRPISITDANGTTLTNQFDAIGELLKRTWPDGISESFAYSTNGLIAYTNRNGKLTIYGRDGAGRMTSIVNANLETMKFAFDSLDNVTSMWDGNTNQTRWQYNEYGWLTNKLDGLNRVVFRNSYNANGLVTNRWTPEKGNTSYAYDGVGNLKSIAYPLLTISYAYDALNRLTNMVDGLGATTFGYTPIGQLKSENGPWTNDTVAYSYVQDVRIGLTLSQPGGIWSQSYGYDSGRRMTNTVSPAGAFNYSYNYHPASALITGISLPNGAKIVNSFDSLTRLTGTALNNYWGNTLDGSTYIPDALGFRTNEVRNCGLTTSTVNVGFDNIGQLTLWSAVETNGILRQNEQLGFIFDPGHNLHSRHNGGLSQTFTTDPANELTNITRTGTFTMSGATPAPATSIVVNGQVAQIYGDFTFARTNLALANGLNGFTNVAVNRYGTTVTNTLMINLPQSVSLSFDNNGNLTNDGTRSFAFDAENQLTNVTVANNWKSDFVYDGLNRRRIERDYNWNGSAWVKTNEVHYIYDGYLVIQERDANNNVLVTYTRGLDMSGSRQGAGGIGGLLARTDSNGTTFYHADGAGDVTALMDSNGNVVARYLYGPFGKLIGQWGPMATVNVMQFSSMPHHNLSGMSLYTFRAYDPNLQRWLGRDPLSEAGGINLYGFAENNPMNQIDSDGQFVLSVGFFIADSARLINNAVHGNATASDAGWVLFDGLCLLADGLTAGGGGEGLELAGAGARAARAVEALADISKLSKAQKATIAAVDALNTAAHLNQKPPCPPTSQSPLHPDTKPYPDPNPPNYEGGYKPSDPVKDHVDARAHGGADEASNLDTKSRESNAIKGGREGALLQYEQYLRDNGMSESDIQKVTGPEWQSIQNDVHGRATDPAKLDQLPAPGTGH
jgi:RHS repeat-associated protein